MDVKINILMNNTLFKRGNTFDKLDGIIISSAPIANIPMNKMLTDLDRGHLFPKCPHCYIRDDGVIYQLLPENYKVKYCGGYADSHYIQIVVSEPSGIKYQSNDVFTVADYDNAKKQFTLCYQSLVELCVSLCKKYSFDPLNDMSVLSQSEGGKRKLCSNYVGIDHILKYFELGYMYELRNKINQELTCGKEYFYNGIDYSHVFDPDYYGYEHPEIKNIVGNDNSRLFQHFIEYGMRDGLQGNKDFNVYVYKNNNHDLTFGLDLEEYYEHYCSIGYKENRKCV